MRKDLARERPPLGGWLSIAVVLAATQMNRRDRCTTCCSENTFAVISPHQRHQPARNRMSRGFRSSPARVTADSYPSTYSMPVGFPDASA